MTTNRKVQLRVTPPRIVIPWQTLRPKFARFIIEFHAGVRARESRVEGKNAYSYPNVLSRIVTFCPRARLRFDTRPHAHPCTRTSRHALASLAFFRSFVRFK